MDSPREGGFLEGRVRELWIRLAQMEAEKLKAVEQAVEEERRRVEGKREAARRVAEREREEVARLRLEAGQEREAARYQLLSAQESQARQVDLVNRLQVSTIGRNMMAREIWDKSKNTKARKYGL